MSVLVFKRGLDTRYICPESGICLFLLKGRRMAAKLACIATYAARLVELGWRHATTLGGHEVPHKALRFQRGTAVCLVHPYAKTCVFLDGVPPRLVAIDCVASFAADLAQRGWRLSTDNA